MVLGASPLRTGSPATPEDWGQGAEGFVDRVGVRKDVHNSRVQHYDVGALAITRCRNTADGAREIVLRAHRIPVGISRRLRFRLGLLHNAGARVE
jgi:hypothetical protein